MRAAEIGGLGVLCYVLLLMMCEVPLESVVATTVMQGTFSYPTSVLRGAIN